VTGVIRLARSRLYVARNASATVVARSRPWMIGGRTVHRRWYATLVERTTPAQEQHWSVFEAGTVLVPPLVVLLAVTALADSVGLGFLAGCIVFFVLAYLGPMQGQRRFHRLIGHPAAADVRTLSQSTGREVFDRALHSADRVSETWPALTGLVQVTDAEEMLNEALWELAGVLVKAEQVHTVLLELSRPEFAQRSRTDETAREVEEQRRATRAALVTLNEEVARRVGGIQRAEVAGWTFIREKEMRQAIHAAEESLRSLRDEEPAAAGAPRPDAGAELAEHTQSVVAAYRELTSQYRTSPPEA
jgi:hypothetical protein